jgi:hypothetical protein
MFRKSLTRKAAELMDVLCGLAVASAEVRRCAGLQGEPLDNGAPGPWADPHAWCGIRRARVLTWMRP